MERRQSGSPVAQAACDAESVIRLCFRSSAENQGIQHWSTVFLTAWSTMLTASRCVVIQCVRPGEAECVTSGSRVIHPEQSARMRQSTRCRQTVKVDGIQERLYRIRHRSRSTTGADFRQKEFRSSSALAIRRCTSDPFHQLGGTALALEPPPQSVHSVVK